MRYLVCYDIGDDKRRNRLADVLMDFGPRLQESVFLVDLDEELLDRMKKRVERTVDSMVDVVHVFAFCGTCAGKVWAVGPKEVPTEPTYYVF